MATPRKPKDQWEKIGRPTKYKKEYCQMLREHMAEGLSYTTFQAVIFVSIETLYTWEKKHPAFLEAKKQGFAAGQMFWEKMGRSGAAGKLQGFQTGAWVFNMKNRFRWKDRQEITMESDVTPWSKIESGDDD